ncbi:Protein CBR-SRX-82 [Caenorhabditis briggsae]|uniref:Protein CBR-SRX-82 n=1 Tax=Caenorhabditis briggsae TaxID=6238 RepID=A8Y478_CAEBR|nr:Protein CBR-SRX-82 [Caenorhabditis briggsae]CAP39698.1 Protein CBR-SRX-82 [Caenorhabditis briggsae]
MVSNLTEVEFTTLNYVASILMIMNGIFGVICNASVIYIFICEPSERTSFNLICAYRSIGNSVILVWGFIGTFVPITLKESSSFSNVYETIVIISCNNIYIAVQYCGLLIALNRFCAMFFPLWYAKFFSIKITFVIVVFHFALKLADNIYYLVTILPKDCYTLFSYKTLSWIPNMDPKCHNGIPNPFNNTAILLILLIVMNVATFSRIYFFFKSTETEQGEMRRKSRKNNLLFSQTVFQDAIMLIDMLFTFKLSEISKQRYWTFISVTLVWQCVHSIDGFVMVMFNERLSLLKSRLFGSREEASHTNPQIWVSVRH